MKYTPIKVHTNNGYRGVTSVSSVTMRQARLALLSAGLLDQIDPAIDAMPEPDRTVARIEWDHSSEVHRNKPFVIALGAALGLDDEGIDTLFAAAAGIE